jgi:predicted hotdog family 3-hydroxylacyl-ACP dehydratase
MTFDLKAAMAHKPPMLLIDEIKSSGGNWAETSFKINPDNIFLEAGCLRREALAEIMAQTLAAFNAFNAAKYGGPSGRKGFLVGLKNITFSGDAFACDDLRCRVEIVDFISQTYIARGAVYKDAQKLAEGEIRIFVFD